MIRIDLPFPDKKLHAHNTGHWRSKADAVANMRGMAKLLAMRKGNTSVGKAAVCHYRFRVPDNVRRDVANMIQSCKPAIDGIVDSGLLADDCWQVLSLGRVEVVIDRNRPGVDIVIEAKKVERDGCEETQAT